MMIPIYLDAKLLIRTAASGTMIRPRVPSLPGRGRNRPAKRHRPGGLRPFGVNARRFRNNMTASIDELTRIRDMEFQAFENRAPDA